MFRRVAVLLLATGAVLHAAAAGAADGPRRWNVHIDNDEFAFGDRDRDYTAGFAVTLEGEDANRHPASLSAALTWIDGISGFDSAFGDAAAETPALEIGLLLFTPNELSAADAGARRTHRGGVRSRNPPTTRAILA